LPAQAASKAPQFSLKGDQSNVSLSSYKGKVVYVDFWASWCKPCRKSFPFLNEMHERYKKKGLKVIGINLDSNQADAQKFLKRFPANFIIAYDPEGETPKQYHLSVMPTSYLIDRKGNLINIHKGFKEGQTSEIEHKIQQALAKK
jgi:thiol-disulfide isomerase/thioredoxin